jgi:hypothetical protein
MVVEGKETPMRTVGRIALCIALVLAAFALGVATDTAPGLGLNRAGRVHRVRSP